MAIITKDIGRIIDSTEKERIIIKGKVVNILGFGIEES
jgi:hypothetical protein